jgi:hypothetical protein
MVSKPLNNPVLGRRPPKIPPGGGPGPENPGVSPAQTIDGPHLPGKGPNPEPRFGPGPVIPPRRGPEIPEGSTSPLDEGGEEADGSPGA